MKANVLYYFSDKQTCFERTVRILWPTRLKQRLNVEVVRRRDEIINVRAYFVYLPLYCMRPNDYYLVKLADTFP